MLKMVVDNSNNILQFTKTKMLNGTFTYYWLELINVFL